MQIISMASIIPYMYSVAIGLIFFMIKTGTEEEIFTTYLKFAQCTCTCLSFQQKYLYLAKFKVLVLKYIVDVLNQSLASIVVSMLMASIIVASHSQR